jgi:hypothetical protein
MEKSLDIPLTLHHYETLIQAFALSGDLNGAVSTYSYVQSMVPSNTPAGLDMSRHVSTAMRPTEKTQNILLLACAKAADFTNVSKRDKIYVWPQYLVCNGFVSQC